MLQLTIKKSIAAFVSLIMMLMIVSYFPSSAFRVNAVTSADLSISDNGIQFICSLIRPRNYLITCLILGI